MADLTSCEFKVPWMGDFTIKCAQENVMACPALKSLSENKTYTLEIWLMPNMHERSVTAYPTTQSDRDDPMHPENVLHTTKNICRRCKYNKTKSKIR